MEDAVAPLPEPTERLPPEALTYWRLRTGLNAGAVLVAAIVAAAALGGALGWLLPLAALTGGTAAIVVLPSLRHRRWRYSVRDEEIDIRHGTFVVRRTVVPIRRVQHVDTETGPLQGSFELSAVAFFTAAGKTEIPALKTARAELVRARIAQLARTLDDV